MSPCADDRLPSLLIFDHKVAVIINPGIDPAKAAEAGAKRPTVSSPTLTA